MRLNFEAIPIPLGMHFLRRMSGVNPIIINYHMVSYLDLPQIKHLYQYRNIEGFKSDLEFFRMHFNPLVMSDFLAYLSGARELPANSIMLTFDDGFREVYDVAAPILEDLGFPATFFLTSDFLDNKLLNHDNRQSLLLDHLLTVDIPENLQREIDEFLKDHLLMRGTIRESILGIPYQKRNLVDELANLIGLDFNQFLKDEKPYLTSSQVESLIKRDFSIGSHSLDHARFIELDDEEQFRQVSESMESLVTMFSLDYRVFAFPYSDRGVNSEVFSRLSGIVDASFGTHGLLDDPVANHFQRISVEKYPQSAKKTCKYHYTRKSIYNLLKRNYVSRP